MDDPPGAADLADGHTKGNVTRQKKVPISGTRMLSTSTHQTAHAAHLFDWSARVIKNILGVERNFAALSTKDLLDARDQYHWHLIHKKNVVGTAIGLYLIRNGDERPSEDHSDSVYAQPVQDTPRPARTFYNSRVRENSWPCVIVLVDQWREPYEFGTDELAYDDWVPKTLYMPDGRLVPVCVVCVRPAEPDLILLPNWNWPEHLIGGGFPMISRAQGVDHVASAGCLVTDGHQIYALTNRHVAGPAGHVVESIRGGRRVEIGKSSAQQITRKPFSEVYPEFVARRTFLTLDAGLIEVTDATEWTSQVYGLGKTGELADLSERNIGTRLINAEVIAYGAASGLLRGRIAALFFRHHSIGGYDEVTDFLIAPSSESTGSHPGDSGTVWHLLTGDAGEKPRPLALQWGGQGFLGATGKTFNFTLASGLSNILRLLEVELVTEHNTGAQPFWGKTGHYSIATFACGKVVSTNLKDLLQANLDRISFPEAVLKTPDTIDSITKDAKKNRLFVPLADVPDVIWKNIPHKVVNGEVKGVFGGRDTSLNQGPEHPTHFANIDEANADGQTLLAASLADPNNVSVDFWNTFYENLGHTNADEKGLLPFRVWQFFNAMVDALNADNIEEFVCAAGILAHYVGDACQPLHSSFLFNGFEDGSGKGVHKAYEDAMVDHNATAAVTNLTNSLATVTRPPNVTSGHEAAVAIVRLMDRTASKIDPTTLINAFIAAGGGESHALTTALFSQFGVATGDVMADGTLTLAVLWESAWQAAAAEGRFTALQLGPIDHDTLRKTYEKKKFVRSFDLDHIAGVLH
jgi:hypothetical protein